MLPKVILLEFASYFLACLYNLFELLKWNPFPPFQILVFPKSYLF